MRQGFLREKAVGAWSGVASQRKWDGFVQAWFRRRTTFGLNSIAHPFVASQPGEFPNCRRPPLAQTGTAEPRCDSTYVHSIVH